MQIPEYLVNEHFDDRYFDVVSALDEAQQIFFKNNSILDRIASAKEQGKALIIGETGFGAGRLVVALMEYLNKSGQKNITIEYKSVELYPMSPERMESILGDFKDRVKTEIECLLEAYKRVDVNKPGWHKVTLTQPFGQIELNLWVGEALEMVEALEEPCDVWFLDGHGPKKNPSIWRPELLMAIGEKTKTGGCFATFTVAGEVKRGLISAGFEIKKLPGCGGKNFVLQGTRQ